MVLGDFGISFIRNENEFYLNGLTKKYACEDALEAFYNCSTVTKEQLREFERYSFFAAMKNAALKVKNASCEVHSDHVKPEELRRDPPYKNIMNTINECEK